VGKRMLRRILSMVLCAALLISMLPANLMGETAYAKQVLFNDDFESYAVSTSPIGKGVWVNGTGNGTWSIDSGTSNVLKLSTAGSTFVVAAGEQSWGDYSVSAEARITGIPTSGTARSGVIARYQDKNNYYVFFVRRSTTKDDVVLTKRVNNSEQSAFQTAVLSETIDVNKVYHLTLEVEGNQLKGYVDGNLVVSATDESFSSGKVGLYSNSGSAYTGTILFDDVVVTSDGGSVPSDELAAPANLASTARDGEVSLTWNPSPDADSYNIKRGTVSGAVYETIDHVTHPLTVYTDTGVVNGTTYYYVVSAQKDDKESAHSNEVSATPQKSVEPPDDPGSSDIPDHPWWGERLFHDNFEGYASFPSGGWVNSTNNGSWVIADIGGSKAASQESSGNVTGIVTNGDLTWTNYAVTARMKRNDASLRSGLVARYKDNNNYYFMYLRGNNLILSKKSGSSSEVQIKSVSFANTANTWYTMTLEVNASSIKGYIDGQLVMDHTDDDQNLTAGKMGFYIYGTGIAFDDARVHGIPPEAPAKVSITEGDSQLHITWDPVFGASSYRVKRSMEDGGPYTEIADRVVTTEYVDSGLINGTTYYYVVTAVSSVGEGKRSIQAAARPQAATVPPSPPATFTAADGEDEQVTLTWAAVAGASSYNILRGTAPGGPYVNLHTNFQGTTYVDTNVTNGTTYYYIVRAVNPIGESANSIEVQATPVDYEGRTIYVSTSSALSSAIADAQLGDTIILANGDYSTSISMNGKHGSAKYPILIKAENRGQAKLTGGTVSVSGSSHITFDGLYFANSGSFGARLTNNQYITIQHSIFKLPPRSGGSTWLQIDGPNSKHNQVLHNLFEDKQDTGKFIIIGGDNPGFTGISQYDVIAHNTFRKTLERQTNESEPIRIGESKLSLYNSYTTVEYNTFEQTDSDPEIISVKSGGNIIRYNTFIESLGTLSLRHGNGSVVYGNRFLGNGRIVGTLGTGGIRIYGEDHLIFNNYFEGLTGSKWDAAITLTNGNDDDAAPGKTLNKHYIAKNILIANNTMVNNYSNIEIGFQNSGGENVFNRPVKDITIANNIVVGSQKELVEVMTQPVNLVLLGNMMYPQEDADLVKYPANAEGYWNSLEETQIKVVNPLLALQDGLYRLTFQSPAINAAIGDYTPGGLLSIVTEDMDGKPRNDGFADVGAEEFDAGEITDLEKPIWKTAAPLQITQVGSDRIVLQWEHAEDNMAIVGYQVYQNDELLTTVSGTVNRFTADHLISGQTYQFKLRAVDLAGNLSEFSNTVSDTTPTLSAIQLVGLSSMVAGGAPQTIGIEGVYSNGSTETISTALIFESTDESVAVISSIGVITALKAGTTEIRAHHGGFTAKYVLQVFEANHTIQFPVHDSYVRGGGNALDNFGTGITIWVKREGSEYRDGYVMFELPTIEGEEIDMAEFKLYVSSLDSNTSSYDIQIIGLEHDTWDETTINYDNQPAEAGSVLASAQVNEDHVGTYLVFDVSEFVKNQTDGKVTLKIRGVTSGRGAKYATKEGEASQQPQLVLTMKTVSIGLPDTPQQVSVHMEEAGLVIGWESVHDTDSYILKRSTSQAGPYTTIAQQITSNSYSDSDVTSGITYYYRVIAVNEAGESEPSDVVSATFHREEEKQPPKSPAQVSAATGHARVELTWEAVSDAESYTVKRSLTNGGPYSVIAQSMTNQSYLDTELTNGLTYYYVITSVNEAGESEASEQISATPYQLAAPGEVTAAASSGKVSLTWTAVNEAVSYAVKRSTSHDGPYVTLAAGIETTSYHDEGLTNGLTYYYVIVAVDKLGEEGIASSQASATPTQPANPDSGTEDETLEPTVTPNAEPSVTPKMIDEGLLVSSDSLPVNRLTNPDGSTSLQVNMNEQLLDELLQLLETRADDQQKMVIDVGESADMIRIQLPGAALADKDLQSSHAIISVQSVATGYELPLKALNVESLSQQLGVEMKDITISITMAKTPDWVSDQISQNGVTMLGDAMQFSVTVEAGRVSFEVTDFEMYVSRFITINQSIDPNKTTGVLFDPETGRLFFVPTLFVEMDGIIHAVLRRPGNSIYSVVEHEKTFDDIPGHWAKQDIELLASKLLLQGMTDSTFGPDSPITRAQFATLLVRALGLTEQSENSRFTDVASDAWYAGAVGAAAKAGLITGYEDGTFRPEDWITREQMAVMTARATKAAGKIVDVSGKEQSILDTLSDGHHLSTWVKTSVAQTMEAGIMTGLDANQFDGQQYATRAQAALILKRLLQFVDFMNK
jgi:fibronectin type 3 domain-containing protein